MLWGYIDVYSVKLQIQGRTFRLYKTPITGCSPLTNCLKLCWVEIEVMVSRI